MSALTGWLAPAGPWGRPDPAAACVRRVPCVFVGTMTVPRRHLAKPLASLLGVWSRS